MDSWKPTEVIAAATGASAPVWVTALQEANLVLGTVSALLSIAFVLWRWRRSVRNSRPENPHAA